MEQPQYSFSHQLKALWRYKWWIIAVTMVAGLTSFYLVFTQPVEYQATTTLMTDIGEQKLTAIPSGISGGLELTYLQDITNQIQIMRSRTVLEKAVLQIDPALADDDLALQLEIQKLNESLSIRQISSTNLVEIIVTSIDPDVAELQANAIAKNYVEQVKTLTNDSIQNALEDVSNRLEELQNAEVDLSVSPVFLRLTSQLETAFQELQKVSDMLQTITPATSNVTANNGTVLSAFQLDTITDRINTNHLEGTEISSLVDELQPISLETDLSARSAALATIESRTRALSTRLANLSSQVSALKTAETNSLVASQLVSVEEYLQIATSTADALLSQITTLYGIQTVEADVNALNRINRNITVLVTSLKSASDTTQEIVTKPIDSSYSLLQSYSILNNRVNATIALFEKILSKFTPEQITKNVFVSYNELSEIDLMIQNISISLSFISSDISRVEAQGVDNNNAELLNIQESIRIATNAIEGLDNEITNLMENAGDVSYNSLDTLRQELQLALLSSDVSSTRVLDTAVSTISESMFSRYRSVLLAIIAALLISAIYVIAVSYISPTIHDGTEVTNQLGIPMLARIKSVRRNNSHISSILDDVPASYLESFRLLRTNLNLDSVQGKILLISSPKAQEGKTTVASNLARIISLQSRRVLLVDGNLHNPDIANIFGVENDGGLSDLLAFGKEDYSFITEQQGIDILPAGPPSKIAAELLSSPRLKAFLEKARKEYDIIIVDSAPVVEWTDTRILARNIDTVLLVLRNNLSNVNQARESKQALEAVGARIEGFVLVDTN